MIRILLGGSPCTKWSIAQKNNRETEPKGEGWELFRNYLIAKEKYKPDYFLYENNKSAAAPIKAQIRKELNAMDIDSRFLAPGQTQYIEINSALVSAQNRQRFYVHNMPGVQLPEDRGILLKDVLESGTDLSQKEKAYTLTTRCGEGAIPEDTLAKHRHTMVAEPIKIREGCKLIVSDESIRNTNKDGTGTSQGYTINYIDGKSATLTSGHASKTKIIEPIRIGTIESNAKGDHDSKQYRVYSPEGKATTLCGEGGGIGAKTGLYACPADGKAHPIYRVLNGLITIKGKQYPIKLPDGLYIIRKLTVKECCRLQTFPDNYFVKADGSPLVSNTQAYKQLGNSWTIEVIKHILQNVPNIKNEPIEVLSMYDGISAGQLGLKQLGANVISYKSTEIDKYAIQTTQYHFPRTAQLGDAFAVRNEDWRF